MDTNNSQLPGVDNQPSSFKDRVAQKLNPTEAPPSESSTSVSFLDRIQQILGTKPTSVVDTPTYHSEDYNGIFNNKETYERKDNMQPYQPQISSDSDKVAAAIMQQESGGIQRKGASGESASIFQFMPATWQAISKQVTGNVLPQTVENEWKVASGKIAQLYDKYISQGLSKEDAAKNVALIWNTSLGGSEKPLVKKGVNKSGVKYDSLAYANKILANLKKYE